MFLLIFTASLCFASKQRDEEFGKAAHYDGQAFLGFYPIFKAEKSGNAYKIKLSKDGKPSTKTREQLLNKEESNFAENDLVRLEGDFGLVIRVLDDSLLKIQWLENDKPISIKHSDDVVLFQKDYAAPDEIKKKYTTREQIDLSCAELQDLKWGAYHDFGDFAGYYRINRVDLIALDSDSKMFRVDWEDGQPFDVLKSADELYKTKPKDEKNRKHADFAEKLKELDPAASLPPLLKSESRFEDPVRSKRKRVTFQEESKFVNRNYSPEMIAHVESKMEERKEKKEDKPLMRMDFTSVLDCNKAKFKECLHDSQYGLYYTVGSQWHFPDHVSSKTISQVKSDYKSGKHVPTSK